MFIRQIKAFTFYFLLIGSFYGLDYLMRDNVNMGELFTFTLLYLIANWVTFLISLIQIIRYFIVKKVNIGLIHFGAVFNLMTPVLTLIIGDSAERFSSNFWIPLLISISFYLFIWYYNKTFDKKKK